MKTYYRKQYEYLLPLFCSLLYFLITKNKLPASIYVVFAIFISSYFIPIRQILNSIKEKYNSRSVFNIISSVNFTLLVFLSALIQSNHALNLLTLYKILSIFNFILLSYFYLKGFERSVVLTHLGFTVLTAAVIGL